MKSLIARTGVVLTMLAVGIALFSFAASPATETVARQQAILSMAPGQATSSNEKGATSSVTGGSAILSAVSPSTVDFSTVKIETAERTNSVRNRYLRGEIDFSGEGIIGAAQLEAMKRAALTQPVDANVQIVGPGSNTPTPLGTSFDSIDYTEAGGSVPPDPEMAAGLNHLVATVNVSVEIYDKSGNSVLGPTAPDNLFSTAPCNDTATFSLFDPNIIYDEEEDRWIMGWDLQDFSTLGATGGYCLLASQTGDPTGVWNEYYFNVNTATGWMDYPHAGVGDEFIFMGANYFSASFVESKIHAWSKADLYAGNPVATYTRSLGSTYDTPQPLNLHGASTGTWPAFGSDHYFLTEHNYNGQDYGLIRWNPKTDDLDIQGDLDFGPGALPVDSVQNGTVTLNSGDYRPLDFEYRNGYGWSTNTISCNPGTGTVNCVRWGQIDLFNTTFGPAGTGTIASNGEYRQHPDLAVDHCDAMALGYTKSSASTFPSVYVTGRQASDAANTVQAEVLVKAGEIAYTSFQTANPHRWGDYTGMTIDPDGYTFWYLGEYSKDTGTTNGRWGNWIASFSYNETCDAPPADLEISKAVAPASTVMVGDQITYTITVDNNGSGFGDTTISDALPSELDGVVCYEEVLLCPSLEQIGSISFDCGGSLSVAGDALNGASGGRPGTVSCTGTYVGTDAPISYIDLAGLTWTSIGGSWMSELQAFFDCPAGGTSDYLGSIGGAPGNTNGNAAFTAGSATSTGCSGESPVGVWTVSWNEDYGDNFPNPDSNVDTPVVVAVYGIVGGDSELNPIASSLNENIAEFRAFDEVTYICTGTVSQRACNGEATNTLLNTAMASADQDASSPVTSNQVSTTVDVANSDMCQTLAVDVSAVEVSAESTLQTTTMLVIATVALSLIATTLIVRRRTN